MKLGVFYFVEGRALPSESFPSFEPGITMDLSATAPCEATIQNLIPVVIPRLDALRASDDAVHTVEGKKARLLIVAACRNFACVALHYASVKFGQSRELVHRHIVGVLNDG